MSLADKPTTLRHITMNKPLNRDEDIQAWVTLDADIVGWDGTLDVGRRLLERLSALPALQGGAESVGSPVAVRLQASRKKLLKGAFDDLSAMPDAHLRLAPLVDGVTWPWADPTQLVRKLHLSGAKDAFGRGYGYARLAGSVIELGTQDTEGARAWLNLALRLRERDYWVPVALVWSGLLASGRAPADDAAWFERCVKAIRSAKGGAKPDLGEDDHIERHVRTLAALVAIRQGKVGDSTASQWLDSSVTNYHTTTAAAGAFVESALVHEGALREQAEALAVRALESLYAAKGNAAKALTYQAWEPARRLVEHRRGAVPEGVLRLLFDANPHGNDRAEDLLAGDLFDAGVTLRWLEGDPDYCELGDKDALPAEFVATSRARLLDGRLKGRDALVRAASYDANEWGDRLARALTAVQPERWRGLPKSERVGRLVEAAWLVELPEAGTLAWQDVVRGVDASWLDPSEGTVKNVGWVDLAAVAAERKALFAYLLHRREVDSEVNPTPTKGDAKAEKTSGNDGRSTPPPMTTHGLARLLRSRWRRDDEGWTTNKHLTQQAGNHFIRRLVRAHGNDAELARLLLVVISIDAPPDDARTLLKRAPKPDKPKSGEDADGGFWSHVADWVPLDDVRKSLAPLVRWEKLTTTTREACIAEGDAVLAELAEHAEHFGSIQDVLAPVKKVGELALAAAAAAPVARDEPSGEPVWVVKVGGKEVPASPDAMRKWTGAHLEPLAKELEQATRVIEKHLRAPGIFGGLSDREIREHREAVSNLGKLDAPLVDCPLLDDDSADSWRRALRALRKLAEPLPTPSEIALDAVGHAVEMWIKVALKNHERRQDRLREMEEAMTDGREDDLMRLIEENHQLLGKGELRKAGNYFLHRLNFKNASRIRDEWHAPVPTTFSFFSPLLFGVVGAPLSSIQTDKIWQPVLKEVAETWMAPHYHLVAWLPLLVSGYMLLAELRRAAASLDVREALRRAVKPLLVLFAINYAINAGVYWVAPQGVDVNPAGMLATVFLWGNLSLFIGVFLGLIAQGRRPMEEGA